MNAGLLLHDDQPVPPPALNWQKQRRARSLLYFENLVEAFRAPLLCHGFKSGGEQVKLREPSFPAFTLSGTIGEPSIRFPGKSLAGTASSLARP
jgi:hypothetical protein